MGALILAVDCFAKLWAQAPREAVQDGQKPYSKVGGETGNEPVAAGDLPPFSARKVREITCPAIRHGPCLERPA